ncbi:MAG: hypothetical protein AAF491_04575 [Verrucomicrobiota bacterium]
MKPFTLSALLSLLSISAFANHALIEGSTSPNGRYGVGWSAPGLGSPEVDLDRVENLLIDLHSGEPVAVLTTTYFVTADFEKNHSSLFFSWKSDSRALVVFESAKWGLDHAEVVYIPDPDHPYDPCSDVIPLTKSLEKAAFTEMGEDRPDLVDTLDDYVVSVFPILSTWEETLELNVVAEVPKDPDTDVYEKAISVALPGPDLVELVVPEVTPQSDLITSSSVGPVQLKMSIGEVRAFFPEAHVERTSDGEGIAYVALVDNGDILFEMATDQYDPEAPIQDTEIVEFIKVRHPRYATAEGIRIGTKLTEAETRLGSVKEILISEIEAREFASFVHQPSGINLQVTHPDDTAGVYEPGEFITQQYREGASVAAISVDGPFIMIDGSIGGIRLSDSSDKVLARAAELGLGPIQKSTDEIWEAYGQAVQSWTFPEAGLSLDMVSDEVGGEKEVLSITLDAPGILGTGAGIQIGADKSDVEDAYQAYEITNEDFDDYFGEEDVHLIGSIYGGMIFNFENGKLRRIFLGAAAE